MQRRTKLPNCQVLRLNRIFVKITWNSLYLKQILLTLVYIFGYKENDDDLLEFNKLTLESANKRPWS